jgi:hypothetical protein
MDYKDSKKVWSGYNIRCMGITSLRVIISFSLNALVTLGTFVLTLI